MTADMAFDRDIHNRQSMRLFEYDYSSPGHYYVTICTQNRACLLGQIIDDMVLLSSWGNLAYKNSWEIPKHFPFVELDRFVVMPNHIHGIIYIREPETSQQDESVAACSAQIKQYEERFSRGHNSFV